MILLLATILSFDGYLGRSGDVNTPLAPLPPGVTWTRPKDEPRQAYTSYVQAAVAGVGRLTETGELLVSTQYPEMKLHLFGKDGKEVTDGGWPRGGSYQVITDGGGFTWGLQNGATQITRRQAAKPVKIGGSEADYAYGIVAVDSGYWIACRQGWVYYDKTDLAKPVRRHGSLRGVTALVLLDGRVYAFYGSQIAQLWLDDKADEPISKVDLAAGRWVGTVDAAEVVDGVIRYSFTKENKHYLLDPRITEWVFRNRREHPTNDPVMKKPNEATLPNGLRAVADGKTIVVKNAKGIAVQTLSVPATLLASEGRWLVAYVPKEQVVYRYHVKG